MFGLRDPQAVFLLDADLPCHILATEPGVRGKPCGRVAIRLALVRRAVHRQQVVWIVRQVPALVFGELLRALLPCVGKRHHMVDLHGGARVLPAHEVDARAGVRVLQHAARHHTVMRVRLVGLVGQVAVEDVVAGIAAVVVHVGPCRAELVAAIPGLRRTALHCKRVEHGERVVLRAFRRLSNHIRGGLLFFRGLRRLRLRRGGGRRRARR